jgi:hypothetical protein
MIKPPVVNSCRRKSINQSPDRHAASCAAPLELVQRGDDEARAGGTDRMTERDRAAIDI